METKIFKQTNKGFSKLAVFSFKIFFAFLLVLNIPVFSFAQSLILEDNFEDGNYNISDSSLAGGGISWIAQGSVIVRNADSAWSTKRLSLYVGSKVLSDQTINQNEYTLTFDAINWYRIPSKVQFYYLDENNYYYFNPATGQVWRRIDGSDEKLSDILAERYLLQPRSNPSKNNYKIYFKNDGTKILIEIDKDGYQNGLDYEFSFSDTNSLAVSKFKNGAKIGFTEEGSGTYNYWVNYDNIKVWSGKYLATPPRSPTTLYVDKNNGLDTNPGSVTQPFATIQKAIDSSLPGDTILVKPAQYDENIVFKPYDKIYATKDKRLTIKSEQKHGARIATIDFRYGDYITLDGFEVTTPIESYGGAISISGSKEVRVINNYLHDLKRIGIDANGEDGYVARNYILRANEGIVVGGKNMLVENNEIERLIYHNQDADYFRFFGEGHIIRKNYMHGTKAEEIGPSHTDGFQTFGVNGECAKNIVIEGNFIKDFHHQSFMLSGQGCHDNIIIRNNVLSDAGSWGVSAHGITNLRIYNNNFLNIGFHGIGFRESQASDGTIYYSTGEIKNNIFYNAGSNYWKTTGSSYEASNNLLYKSSATINPASYPQDIVNQDPLFIDPVNYDFHLKPNSPAINNGIVISGFNYDKDGISRPQGAGWDIGAYEYVSAPPDTTPPSPPKRLRVE